MCAMHCSFLQAVVVQNLRPKIPEGGCKAAVLQCYHSVSANSCDVVFVWLALNAALLGQSCSVAYT